MDDGEAILRPPPRKRFYVRPLVTWCPEDLVYHVHKYLTGRDLAQASAVCREFYFSAFLAASRHFFVHFGEFPPALPQLALSRLRLFSMVDRVHLVSESNHRDLMLWSACRGYTKMIRSLASSSLGKIYETKQTHTGATPLILACEHGQLKVVQLLLELGADIARGAGNGLNALHVACKNGHADIVRVLLAQDSEICNSRTSDGRTPLMFAAASGQTEIVNMLIEAKCDLDMATEFDDADADIGGETALHLAAFHGHTDILSILLRNHAEPNMSMRNGRTPLIISAEQGRGDVLRLLLEHGCNVHAVTNSGKTALYSACENGHAHIVPSLLDYGSDVNQATRRNKIPLYVAAEKGYVEIARILLSRAGGNDLFVRTKYGTTPMFIASKTSNPKMKALLMEFCNPKKKPAPVEGGKSGKKKRKGKGGKGEDSDMDDDGVEESKFGDGNGTPSLDPASALSAAQAAAIAVCPVHGNGRSAPSSPARAGAAPLPRPASPRSPRTSSIPLQCTCGIGSTTDYSGMDPAVLASMAQREVYLAQQRAALEAQQRRQDEWRARQRARQKQALAMTELPRFAEDMGIDDDPPVADYRPPRGVSVPPAGGAGGPVQPDPAEEARKREKQRIAMEKMAERARQRIRDKEKEKEAEVAKQVENERKRVEAEERRRAAEEARAAKDRKARALELKKKEDEARAEMLRALEEKKAALGGGPVEPEELEAAEREARRAKKSLSSKKKQLSMRTVSMGAEDSTVSEWVTHSMGSGPAGGGLDDGPVSAPAPAAAASAAAASVLASRADSDGPHMPEIRSHSGGMLLDLSRSRALLTGSKSSKSLQLGSLPGTGGSWSTGLSVDAGVGAPAHGWGEETAVALDGAGKPVSSPIAALRGMPSTTPSQSTLTRTTQSSSTFLQRQHEAEREREERLAKLKREETEKWEKMYGVQRTEGVLEGNLLSITSSPSAISTRPLSAGRYGTSPRASFKLPTATLPGASGVLRAASPIKGAQNTVDDAQNVLWGSDTAPSRPRSGKSRGGTSPRPPLHGKGRRVSRGDGTLGL